ncbi:hypothetical protein [Labedaea rhizosphaerae]|uniref:Uncharacterized protein n=1 Tax=Labedaea rhizosphaerae TaxID=598644 RepID=A0A4R6S9T3_LABRH|nr:hypothetical protein [Labedaea rhizosphaerae]TDP96233.1 hypothetical protein EV186_104217 [Labedaea rhizosphaerae]
MSWWDKVLRQGAPEGFSGKLDAQENVLATAEVTGGGHVLATSHGLWLPDEDGARRIGWHLISKATWGNGSLVVIEAVEDGHAGAAVLLSDLPARRYKLAKPGKVPQVVQERVTGSIKTRHRQEFPGGGAWFVQRKVAGRDGFVLQVRPDPGTDRDSVAAVAEKVAAAVEQAREKRAAN